jgi:hypothetical protein
MPCGKKDWGVPSASDYAKELKKGKGAKKTETIVGKLNAESGSV